MPSTFEYYLVIKYTDAPASSTRVVFEERLFLTKREAKQLRTRMRELFSVHGDGNDCWYKYRLTRTDPDDVWTADDMTDYLDDLQIREGVVLDRDAKRDVDGVLKHFTDNGFTAVVLHGETVILDRDGHRVPSGTLLALGVEQIGTHFYNQLLYAKCDGQSLVFEDGHWRKLTWS